MPNKHLLKSTLKYTTILFFSCIFFLIIISSGVFIAFKSELPDIKKLDNVDYQTPLSIYSSDHLLLAQFGEKKRTPIIIDKVPQQLIHAFLAAEDAGFYTHTGVDYLGIMRATWQLLLTGKKKQGGSTITMQVARNFFLTRKKTYTRKIKEIILSLQIEQVYAKAKILELYLNKIYLGRRSYGVVAAAFTYYNQPLSHLNLAQFAMIAGLPKAPSSYNPIANPKKALQRRNYVLRRMLLLKYISVADFDVAIKSPITAAVHSHQIGAPAPYIAEMVRKEIVKQYGKKAFTLGLKVYTTINSTLQDSATRAVRSALHNYDQRHGYRILPEQHKIAFDTANLETIADTQVAHVIAINDEVATVKLISTDNKTNNDLLKIPFAHIKWARKFVTRNQRGVKLQSIHEILSVNDLIRVRQQQNGDWTLAQIPDAEAAFVALNSKNGAILALSGGFDFFHNKYNRVTQSKRQPGSGFKPIIYTSALENGFTTASLINDAPVVIRNNSQNSEWRPQNYNKKFAGIMSLRTALQRSINLVSVRLLQELGMKTVTNTAIRFGFKRQQIPKNLSLALGSGYATPLQMASVFSVFANGGFQVQPYFIERIEDSKGKALFQVAPKTVCLDDGSDDESGIVNYCATRIISPKINFLMNSLLRSVVQKGTARRAKVLRRDDLAGKTGTTNKQQDAWFNGFSADIAASAWVGFDSVQSLGRYESGSKTALPIWIDFMRTALKNKPEQVLEIPDGISKIYIDPKTGKLATLDNKKGIWEFFRDENIPNEYSQTDDSNADDEDSLF